MGIFNCDCVRYSLRSDKAQATGVWRKTFKNALSKFSKDKN